MYSQAHLINSVSQIKNIQDLLDSYISRLYAQNWSRVKSKLSFNYTNLPVSFLFSEIKPYSFKCTATVNGKQSDRVFSINEFDAGRGWINSFISNPAAQIPTLNVGIGMQINKMKYHHFHDELFNRLYNPYGNVKHNGVIYDDMNQDDDLLDLDYLANMAATSDLNGLPKPTLKQKQNNDYQTGSIKIGGLDIEIENPAGSVRSGIGADGVTWSNNMKHHYGFIANTLGYDGDELDVFVKSGLKKFNGKVFVIRQLDQNGEFDEHKLVIGADDADDAKEIYHSAYSDDWTGFGGIEEIGLADLKASLNRQWTEFDSMNNIDLSSVTITKDNVLSVLNSLLSAVGLPENQKNSDLTVPVIKDLGQKIGGARKDTALKIGTRIKKVAEKSSSPSWARRFKVELVPGSEKWALLDTKSKSWYGNGSKVIGTYDTEQEALDSIPIAAVGLKHRIAKLKDGKFAIYKKINNNKTVQVVSQTFNSRDEAGKYMIQNAVDLLSINTTYGEIDLPRSKNEVRIGPKYRESDATGQSFMDSFNLRGVEFGNWNNQKERQDLLNDAYDGLMDLSNILGLPSKSLSLNGELALAFGARGQGLSSAAAHYEPTYAVINLTKKNGAGALAHEWLHAMDHYLARMDGVSDSEWVDDVNGNKIFNTQSNGKDYISNNFSYNSKLPKALRDKWKNLINSMLTKKAMVSLDNQHIVNVFTDRLSHQKSLLDNRIGRVRSDLANKVFTSSRYPKIATEEQLEAFDKYAQAITSGNVTLYSKPSKKSGINVKTTSEIEEISKMLKSLRGNDGFTAKRTGLLDDVVNALDSYLNIKNRVQQEQEKQDNDAPKLVEQVVSTDFYKDAVSLDSGRGQDYWSSKEELIARAFQSYLDHKTNSANQSSPFLNFAPNGTNINTPWGNKYVFPRGEERETINKLFDEFFDELKKNNLLP